jgi:hypothetical protein
MKKDFISVSAVADCGFGNQSSIFPASFYRQDNFFPSSIIYRWISIVQCTYNQSGNYNVKIIPYSSDFPYSINNFTDLQETNGAISYDVVVSDQCIGTLVNDLSKTDVQGQNTAVAGLFDIIIGMIFGAQNLGGKILFAMVILFVFGSLFGSITALITQSPTGYAYGYGSVLVFELVVFTFVYPIFGGALLFSLIILAIIFIVFQTGNRMSGGSRP